MPLRDGVFRCVVSFVFHEDFSVASSSAIQFGRGDLRDSAQLLWPAMQSGPEQGLRLEAKLWPRQRRHRTLNKLLANSSAVLKQTLLRGSHDKRLTPWAH